MNVFGMAFAASIVRNLAMIAGPSLIGTWEFRTWVELSLYWYDLALEELMVTPAPPFILKTL